MHDFTDDEIICLKELIQQHRRKRMIKLQQSEELIHREKIKCTTNKNISILDKVTNFFSKNPKTLK